MKLFSGLLLQLQCLAFCTASARVFSNNWILFGLRLLITRYSGLDQVIFHNQNAVIQSCSMVILLGPSSIFRSLVLNCGRAQELTEIVTVKSTDFKFTMFHKKFLNKKKRLLVCDNKYELIVDTIVKLGESFNLQLNHY